MAKWLHAHLSISTTFRAYYWLLLLQDPCRFTSALKLFHEKHQRQNRSPPLSSRLSTPAAFTHTHPPPHRRLHPLATGPAKAATGSLFEQREGILATTYLPLPLFMHTELYNALIFTSCFEVAVLKQEGVSSCQQAYVILIVSNTTCVSVCLCACVSVDSLTVIGRPQSALTYSLLIDSYSLPDICTLTIDPSPDSSFIIIIIISSFLFPPACYHILPFQQLLVGLTSHSYNQFIEWSISKGAVHPKMENTYFQSHP